MTLKSIYLHIGVLGLPSDYTYAFKKRSRFICNWLEREVLRPLKFKSKRFDRLVVELSSTPRPEAYVNTCKVACVGIPFDRQIIDSSNGITLAELQIMMLKSGIEKCGPNLSIPKTELIRGLNLFVEQGMRNEWLHIERVFKEQNLKARLTCKMTQERFSLQINISSHNKTILEHVILETEPDEVVFHDRFEDIKIDNANLVVTAQIGPPLWTKPLAELINLTPLS